MKDPLEDAFNIMDLLEQALIQKHISAIVDMYVYKLVQGKISNFSELKIPDHLLHTPLFNIEVKYVDGCEIMFHCITSGGNLMECRATVGDPLQIMEHEMKQHSN